MWDGPRRTYTCAYQGSSTAGPLVKHTHKTPLSCRPATSSIPTGPSPLPSRGRPLSCACSSRPSLSSRSPPATAVAVARVAAARRRHAAAARLAAAVAVVAAPRLALVTIAVVVAATVVAHVAAARRCTSVVVARLVTRRSHIVVVARRQARRHRAVSTLRAAVLAPALPSATLPWLIPPFCCCTLVSIAPWSSREPNPRAGTAGFQLHVWHRTPCTPYGGMTTKRRREGTLLL